MHKTHKELVLVILSIILIALITSCSPLTPYAMNDVKHNMTKQQVVSRLGKPYSVKTVRDVEFLTYFVHEDVMDLFLTNRFPFILPYPFVRTGSEYWVILENDKVIGAGSGNQDFGKTKNAKVLFFSLDNLKNDAQIVDTKKVMTNKMMCGKMTSCGKSNKFTKTYTNRNESFNYIDKDFANIDTDIASDDKINTDTNTHVKTEQAEHSNGIMEQTFNFEIQLETEDY